MLRYMNFKKRIEDHLGKYKKDDLQIVDKGKYKHNGEIIEYDYILPKEKEELNLLESFRNQFLKSEYRKDISFHRLFHHLNSSQAMCINFFYPLIKENALETILDILRIKGDINYDSCNISFEKESEIEECVARKTNFDFYMKLNSGIKLYFEIKYTETSFGKAKHDPGHKNKFYSTYYELLHNNPAIKGSYKSEDFFLNNYQLMRNLVHIGKDSYVIFIYPKENKSISNYVLSKKEIIESGWENHFILCTWESLVEQLLNCLHSNSLIDYYLNEFKYKYLDYTSLHV